MEPAAESGDLEGVEEESGLVFDVAGDALYFDFEIGVVGVEAEACADARADDGDLGAGVEEETIFVGGGAGVVGEVDAVDEEDALGLLADDGGGALGGAEVGV